MAFKVRIGRKSRWTNITCEWFDPKVEAQMSHHFTALPGHVSAISDATFPPVFDFEHEFPEFLVSH